MKTSRRILKNIFSLTIAEAANKGILLITAAYLSRVILPEGFGIFGFASAFVIYFLVVSNFGFTTVGIREIARSSGDSSKYINAVFTIRLIISILSILALVISVLLMDKTAIVKLTLLVSGISIISNALLLDWIFQALERMEILAIRQVVTSILTLLGTIVFVHSQSDVVIAMLVMSLSALLNAIWVMIYYLKAVGKIKLSYNEQVWKFILSASLPIGATSLLVAIYNNLHLVLLGFLRSDYDTGIYNAAMKILVVIILPSTIIQNVFFPVLSRAFSGEDRQKIIRKYSTLLFIIGAYFSLFFFTFSEPVVCIAFGPKFNDTATVLKILMVTTILMYTNVSMLAPLMAWDREKQVMYASTAGAFASILLNFILIPHFGFIGAAITSIACEALVLAGFTIYIYRAIKKLYFLDLLKIILLSVLAFLPSYVLLHFEAHWIYCAVISTFLFILIIQLFKIVTIKELKGYFTK